jgi:hypothetical protein
MCLYPKLILNRKYIGNKKNQGKIPEATDDRVKRVPVGCGNCMECRKQKSRQWQTRLHEEIRTSKNGKFITLTFSNESIAKISSEIKNESGYNLDNEIATKAIRYFLERWRKKYKKSLRHWLVTEIGHNGTENIHLHGIIWTTQSLDEVERIWQYGHIWKGKGDKKENYVNGQTVNYIVKYITKMDTEHKNFKSKILTSPGIGGNFINRTDKNQNKYKPNETNESYRLPNGQKTALPTYYRNKIYTEQEREKLWIEKLDKNIRYINGIKVDISKTEKPYYDLLAKHREINAQLGYGNDEKNWTQIQYENERRQLQISKRIAKAKAVTAASGGASPAGQ